VAKAAAHGLTVNQDDWQRRPWSRMFDLVSAEYGWTDSQILDLTPVRLHRIAEAIDLRRTADHRERAKLLEGSTRAVVAAIAASVGDKSGAKKAEKLTLLTAEAVVSAATAAGAGPDAAPAARQAPRMPSTEKALALFGQPLIPMED
jgi:hypothetical protein